MNAPPEKSPSAQVCHGKKDGNRQHSKIRHLRERIMGLRAKGQSCNQIAKQAGVGCKIITRWVRRWNGGSL